MNAAVIYINDREPAERAAAAVRDAGFASCTVSSSSDMPTADALSGLDMAVVLAETYHEDDTLDLCRRIHGAMRSHDVLLLVGVSIYQMPLANAVKEWPDADFIFTPLNGDDLQERRRLLAGEGDADNHTARKG